MDVDSERREKPELNSDLWRKLQKVCKEKMSKSTGKNSAKDRNGTKKQKGLATKHCIV